MENLNTISDILKLDTEFDSVDPDSLLDDKELVDIELHLGVLLDENDCI